MLEIPISVTSRCQFRLLAKAVMYHNSHQVITATYIVNVPNNSNTYRLHGHRAS